VRVRTKKGVGERWVPKPGSAANHFWDAEVYAAAAAKMLRVELLRRPPGAAGDGAPPPPPPKPRPQGPPRRERNPDRFPRLAR
jgi:phage terminase large subunit GpA-like protein